jgi:hypothetical protein
MSSAGQKDAAIRGRRGAVNSFFYEQTTTCQRLAVTQVAELDVTASFDVNPSRSLGWRHGGWTRRSAAVQTSLFICTATGDGQASQPLSVRHNLLLLQGYLSLHTL